MKNSNPSNQALWKTRILKIIETPVPRTSIYVQSLLLNKSLTCPLSLLFRLLSGCQTLFVFVLLAIPMLCLLTLSSVHLSERSHVSSTALDVDIESLTDSLTHPVTSPLNELSWTCVCLLCECYLIVSYIRI